MIFLAEAINLDSALAGGLLGGVIAALAAFLLFLFIIAVAVYVYTSFAFMGIAKKARYPSPAIAWIPFGIGPAIITSKTAKMHWWPILLLIGIFIPFFGGLLMLVFAIFSVIWLWKTFEAIGKPGWWAILCLIPIVNLVLLGIAAWGKK